MKPIKQPKFTCFDCGKSSTGTPHHVLRKNPHGAGVMRVQVCKKCQYNRAHYSTNDGN